ncbi:MAG: hypothetical protein Q7U73_02275 [Rubrivivax sp.]|nr:hypothetical protein [Rubrivivax sp.]
MNLLSLLLPWRRKPAVPHHPRPDETVLPALDSEDENRPRACGWFDSSHDLEHGLCVCEHASADTLARELPLASWLELQLSGWRPGMSVAHQT